MSAATKIKSPPPDKVLSVYQYTNFREYLRDYYDFRKSGERGYSYRAFSKAAGFSSPNFLKLLIDGQRNVSPAATEKLIVGLRLNESSARFFRELVKFNQSKNDQVKHAHYLKMQELSPNARKRNLEENTVKYLSNWIYPLIREMVTLPDFRDDPYWIERRIRRSISHQEIIEALSFLKEKKFIRKNPDNTWEALDNLVISSDEIQSLAIRNYHRQMLNGAMSALQELPLEQREFGAITFNLPPEAVAELKHRLKKFRTEISEWTAALCQEQNEELSSQVVQLNFQMYELTKGVKK
jgi:uncharacterized protein (TIGR02147 family)